MRKLLLALFVAFLVAFWFFDDASRALKDFSGDMKSAERAIENVVARAKEEVIYSKPLVVNRAVSNSALTEEGTFGETNMARAANSSYTVFRNSGALGRIAKLRMNDMFEKGYFEHVSPTGESASSVAKFVGYEYVAIGENIALGNFEDDKALVKAWMDSPGHRANILSPKFTELGIAVGKGIYEGKSVWIAVQIFGKPLSECPSVNESLKSDIMSYQNVLSAARDHADSLAKELENSKPNSRAEREAYNEKVREYNRLAETINSTLSQLKTVIEKYNEQVAAFNNCVT